MKIIVNNEEIDFNGTIKFYLNNPFFRQYNSYTWPFDIPLTIKNKQILNWDPSRLEYTAKITSFPMIIQLPNKTLRGSFNIKKTRTKSINGYFAANNDVIQKLKDTYVNEVAYITPDYTAKTNGDGFAWPIIRNDNLYANANFVAGSNLINPYQGLSINSLNHMNTPFPKLFNMYNKIMKHIDVHFINLLENKADYKDIYVYHNFVATKYDVYTYYGGKEYTITGFSDYYGGTKITINTDGDPDSTFNAMEFIKIADVGINTYDDKIIRCDYLGSGEFHLLNIPYSSDFTTGSSKISYYYGVLNPSYNFKPKASTWDLFDDTLTAWDFFEATTRYLGLVPIFDDAKVTLIPINTIINDQSYIDISQYFSEIDDISMDDYNGLKIEIALDDNDSVSTDYYSEIDNSLVEDPVSKAADLPLSDSAGTIRLVENEDKYYQKNNTGNWSEYSYACNLRIEPGDTLLEETWKCQSFQHPESVDYVQVHQPAIFEDNKEAARAKIRLFFVKKVDGSYVATTEGTNFNLNLNGDTGIFKTNHENYYNWLLNRRKDATMMIAWSKDKLFNPEITKKHRVNNIIFYIKSIVFWVDHDDNYKIGETEIAKV